MINIPQYSLLYHTDLMQFNKRSYNYTPGTGTGMQQRPKKNRGAGSGLYCFERPLFGIKSVFYGVVWNGVHLG